MKNYPACTQLENEIYKCRYHMSTWVKVFKIIPDFRFLRLKVRLKILNFADNDNFSDLVPVYLKVFDHLARNF